MTNVIRSIMQPQNFIWEKLYEEDNVFEMPGLNSHFDCYSFKLLQPTNNGLMLIRVSPRLEVFSNSEVLFIGELTIDYHILDNNLGFADIYRYVVSSANLEFLKAFDEREASFALNKFRPVFSESAVEFQVSLILNPLGVN